MAAMTAEYSTLEGMTWWAYVQRIAGTATRSAIAESVGITAPSVGRWGKGSKPDPEQAAAFARAYQRPVLEAFIAAGYLTADEAGEQPSAPPSLDSLDDDELLAEVRRRMKGDDHGAGQPPAEKRSYVADMSQPDTTGETAHNSFGDSGTTSPTSGRSDRPSIRRTGKGTRSGEKRADEDVRLLRQQRKNPEQGD